MVQVRKEHIMQENTDAREKVGFFCGLDETFINVKCFECSRDDLRVFIHSRWLKLSLRMCQAGKEQTTEGNTGALGASHVISKLSGT